MGIGYDAKDGPPKCSRNAPMASDLDTNMDESPLYTMAQMKDGLPYTSLLWGKECIPSDDTAEASTCAHHDPNESNFRGRQCKNVAHLIEEKVLHTMAQVPLHIGILNLLGANVPVEVQK